jgi:hypothetical protein
MYFQIVLRMIIMILLEELVVPRDFGQLDGLGNSMVVYVILELIV